MELINIIGSVFVLGLTVIATGAYFRSYVDRISSQR